MWFLECFYRWYYAFIVKILHLKYQKHFEYRTIVYFKSK